MRYYLFVDESGDHGLTTINSDFPVFALCGILISETAYAVLLENINALKQRFWPNKKVILHSRDIRKCNKEFSVLLDLSVKQAFYKELESILLASQFEIVAAVIDKKAFIKVFGPLAHDPYEVCLAYLLETTALQRPRIADMDAIEIRLESRGKKEDASLDAYLRLVVKRGTYYVQPAVFADMGFRHAFDRKPDDVVGQQIADLIAYPIATYALDPSRANSAFDLIVPKLVPVRISTQNSLVRIFP